MGTKRQHIVNQLKLELEVENQDQSFYVRHQLGSYWEEWIVPEIDKACNRLNDSDQVVRIEKLEIDLGELFFEDFEEQFREKFLEKLNDELSKKTAEVMSVSHAQTPETTNIALLRYFMQTGQFPWWSGKEVSVNEVFNHVFSKNRQALKELLIEIFGDSVMLKRLVFQIDNEVLVSVLVPVFEMQNRISSIQEAILIFQKEHSLIQWTTEFRQKLSLEGFLALVRRQLHAGEYSEATDIRMVLERMKEVVERMTIKPGAVNGVDIQEDSVENTLIDDSSFQKKDSNAVEKIMTPHAGLILIAPFLPQFFKNNDLLDEDGFVNKEAKMTAIHLLNYIATGEQRAEEHQLSLEKLICGVPFEEPIPREGELSGKNIAEADDLLKSVSEHWRPLRNTSIAGLRDSFLIRDGILYNEGAQWRLRVERKAYDMLLSMITWGFATIKFSWTPKSIETEW